MSDIFTERAQAVANVFVLKEGFSFWWGRIGEENRQEILREIDAAIVEWEQSL